MTAADIVARIRQQLAAQGIAWRAETVDTFKAGDPATEVRGIATTGMATFELLQRAAAAGRNFVIAHEPTFYTHLDQTAALEANGVYRAKQRFIADHQMVVFRFHDHAHLIEPDPLVVGSARVLGLAGRESPTEPRVYVVPRTSLRALARDMAARVGGRALRVCGDPAMPVTRIALGPGYGVPALTADIDVAIGGETPEAGGNAEYALDAMALGRPKAVILLGHMMSEDWGMQEVAAWLRAAVPAVPIEWMPAGEPFA
ncbi:MAG: Nif3-like dinuclear metal center hexameric protein [Acidobacteria bacterium]|nr:Nif3-like dinuclear metal center hexameric protein [Acidobacteriota bacterium]